MHAPRVPPRFEDFPWVLHLRSGERPDGDASQLDRLDRLGRLYRSIAWDGRPLLTARPTSPPGDRRGVMPTPTTVYRLSRFALIRRDGARLIVESPAAWACVIVHDRALMPLLHDLGHATHSRTLARLGAPLPEHVVLAAVALLHYAGLVCHAHGEPLDDEDGPTASAVAHVSFDEDTAPGPAQWAFHDLLFHGRTRNGNNLETLGKTYPFRGRFDPPPALRPPSDGPRLRLPRPQLAPLLERDPPFAAVLEARRSVRRHGAAPLSLDELSELLFRTLRVRGRSAPNAQRAYEFSDRPHPSPGACHPLETYLAVDRCDGLDPGLYRYEPLEHALEPVCESNDGVDRLLQDSAHAAGVRQRPQILMILAARFARVGWAYGPLSYSLILKEVGVVFQSVSLAATAMGLGACVLGVGNSRVFAQLTEIDPLVETSVGELRLGSMPANESTE